MHFYIDSTIYGPIINIGLGFRITITESCVAFYIHLIVLEFMIQFGKSPRLNGE